jgi:acyl-CoA thioester hydrolase
MQKTLLEMDISPRFNETDGLGHINNTVIPVWFEAAREPVFAIFNPELDLNKWNLIVAGFNVAFTSPTQYGQTVKIKTWISRIGNSSFEVAQQSWQGNRLTAEGKTTLVHFDYANDKSQPIPTDIKQLLGLLSGPV